MKTYAQRRGVGRFILGDDGRTAVPCDDLIEWGEWLQASGHRRVVGSLELDGDIRISTVFLGLDHSFGEGPPLLFETMVFGLGDNGDNDFEQRYSTWDEAEEGHNETCAAVERAREESSS